MELFLLAFLLVLLAFLGLGIKIFFTRNGKFPDTEIGQNQHMRELGISCAKCDEYNKWRRMHNNKRIYIIPKELNIDLSKF